MTRTTVALVLVALSAACARHKVTLASHGDVELAAPADSSSFAREVRVWRRDSALADSLARAIAADSVARHARVSQAASASDSSGGNPACTRDLLTAGDVLARATDTLHRLDEREAAARMRKKLDRVTLAAPCPKP